MRKCYFCGKTKGLKGIWLEDDDTVEGHQDSCCCFDCFNNPDNAMEDAPVDAIEWVTTDYHWKTKPQAESSTEKGEHVQ